MAVFTVGRRASLAILLSYSIHMAVALKSVGHGAADAAGPIKPPGKPLPMPKAPPGAKGFPVSTTFQVKIDGYSPVSRVNLPEMLPGGHPNNFATPKPYVEPTTSRFMPIAAAPAPMPAMLPDILKRADELLGTVDSIQKKIGKNSLPKPAESLCCAVLCGA